MSKSDAKYCNRFLDDAPGIRGDCEGRVKLGRPCAECPNRNIRQEVRDLRAERDALRGLLVKANDCLKSVHTFNTLSPEIDAALAAQEKP